MCSQALARLLFLPLLLLPAANSFAATKRILFVGDSWAAGTWHSRAGDKALAAAGLGAFETEGDGTAIGGSRADQWASNANGKLDALRAALARHPSIDIVHLYIGGNDFLRFALANNLDKLTVQEREARWSAIRADIQKLVNSILAVRPDLRVVIVDYDFLNPDRISSVYRAAMPSAFFQVPASVFNGALRELGAGKRAVAAHTPRCFYVENWGLLEQKIGSGAMPDGVHPTPEGFQAIFANVIEKLYRSWLTVPRR